MRKAGMEATPATMSVDAAALQTVCSFVGTLSNAGRLHWLNDIERDEESVRYNREGIEERERAITELMAHIRVANEELAKYPVIAVEPEKVAAELEKIRRFPWVKEIQVRVIGNNPWLMLRTRPQSMFARMTQRYSLEKERRYATRPYMLPLPAYEIGVGLRGARTMSNNGSALRIRLADFAQDTKGIVANHHQFSQQVKPHWGARDTHDADSWSDLCLGEYEGEVMNAFRSSLSQGFATIATYLQRAGDEAAYCRKLSWAMWMGNPLYNLMVFPQSAKAKKEAETAPAPDEDADEDDHDEDDEVRRFNADGEPDEDGEYDAYGELIF